MLLSNEKRVMVVEAVLQGMAQFGLVSDFKRLRNIGKPRHHHLLTKPPRKKVQPTCRQK